MPRADDPRVPVRLSKSDFATIEAAAGSVNVAVGALMRECAVRYAAVVAREIAAGNVTGLRRQRVESAVQAVRGQVAPASLLVPPSSDAMARQARLKAAERRRK
jgi:hypothetical protein